MRCRIVGPYFPEGETEWRCRTHDVEARLKPGIERGERTYSRDDFECPLVVHDPLCPCLTTSDPCQCNAGEPSPIPSLIDLVDARARADERAAIHKALDAEKPQWEAEVRADERERIEKFAVPAWREEIMQDLRAQVEALANPLYWNDGEDALIYRSQVLALLKGESHGDE